MKHWEITKLNYEHATSKNLLQMENIFNKVPELFPNAPKTHLNNWISQGPMSISEIVTLSGMDMKEVDGDQIEIKRLDLDDRSFYGMFDKTTNIPNGILIVIDQQFNAI